MSKEKWIIHTIYTCFKQFWSEPDNLLNKQFPIFAHLFAFIGQLNDKQWVNDKYFEHNFCAKLKICASSQWGLVEK